MSQVIEGTKDIQHAQSELLAFYCQLITNAINTAVFCQLLGCQVFTHDIWTVEALQGSAQY